MEVRDSAEISIDFQRITQLYIPADKTLRDISRVQVYSVTAGPTSFI
jgi:hypothetical protein